MQHPRPEVGQLERFAVAEVIEQHRLGHGGRIGRKQPVDVGPDVEFPRAEQPREDAARMVRAVAPQRRDSSVAKAADEAGDDVAPGRLLDLEHRQPLAAVVPVDTDHQRRGLDAQHVARVDHDRCAGLPVEACGDQFGAEHLAQPGHQLHRFLRRRAHEG
jgi:hypothetical protein